MASSTVEVANPQLNAEVLEADLPVPGEEGKLDQFANWFPRCRDTLQFIACLILGGSSMAEDAVQNCRNRAAQNLRSFESEGFFRAWIMRILINESLSLRHSSGAQAMAANVLASQKK
jgi:DNA-directed RNA polymerase specialized sigma24 family protein